MLQDNPETVCRLIEVAPSYHVREPSSIPEEGGNSVNDRSQQMLADHKDNTGYEELASAVNQLDPDQLREVVAQRWLGRGDYGRRGRRRETGEGAMVARDGPVPD